MKIIHTSDWHLGQELYSFDRTEEHVAFLTQLEEIVQLEQPDVLVISGDIYHIASPSNAVMRVFTDHLDNIRRACPSMKIVVIAGNHDSSARLEVSRTLWGHLGVYVVGKIEKEDDTVLFNHLIIPIEGESGNTKGYVVALPFVQPQAFPLLEPNTPREERQAMFLEALSDKLNEINTDNLPVVMMAHMAIAGSDITGHDQVQGGMDYVQSTELKVTFDYLALGHIHCPQQIPIEGSESIGRYSGSPIPVSFDEQYVHSVTVATIEKHGARPIIQTIPIKNPWPLRTIPKEAVGFEEALKYLENLPDDELCYIRLHVILADIPPQNAMERATTAMKNKQSRFCCFKWERTGEEHNKKRSFADVDQMKSTSPLEIAQLYYENKYGQPLNAELTEMLSNVIKQVQTTHH